jgi:hypothetical protein
VVLFVLRSTITQRLDDSSTGLRCSKFGMAEKRKLPHLEDSALHASCVSLTMCTRVEGLHRYHATA